MRVYITIEIFIYNLCNLNSRDISVILLRKHEECYLKDFKNSHQYVDQCFTCRGTEFSPRGYDNVIVNKPGDLDVPCDQLQLTFRVILHFIR
jgi:hypothetical protein